MKQLSRKALAILLALFITVGMIPVSAMAVDAGVTYTKITSAPDSWDGRYLIVYEGTSKAFDGSAVSISTDKNNAFDGVDVAKDVIIVNDQIVLSASEDNFYVTMEESNGKVYIKTVDGTYVYQDTDANGFGGVTKSAAAKCLNEITFIDGNAHIVGSGGAVLRYNAASNQLRFRYYKSGTYTGQQAVTLYKADYVPSDKETVKDPVASVPSGTVAKGTVVEITCATEGAVITLVNGGTSTVYSGPITINESVKYSVTATKEGCENSKTVVLDYTVSDTFTAEYTETLEDGQKVVLYYPADGKTAAKGTYFYNNKKYELKSLSAAVEGTTLTCDSLSAVLTISTADGHYRFANDDGDYLLLDGTNVSWVAEDAIGDTDYTLFDLETAEGGFFVKSVNALYNGNPQYLEYYNGYFTCYSFNASKADIYTFKFYGIKSSDVTYTKVTDPEKIDETNDVIIYFPYTGSECVMSAKSYRYEGTTPKDELSAVSIKATDGTITFTEDDGAPAAFRMTQDDNGHWTFKAKEGYLYLDGTNVGLKNEPDNTTLFDLEAYGSGYFIKSTNVKISNKVQALEYYKGYFTCYGLSTSSATNYTFQLYKNGKDKEDPSVAAPVADVPAGEIAKGTMVTLTAEDGATIYYEFIGVTHLTTYTGPIEITESCTLRTMAEKDGLQSKYADYEYTVAEPVTDTFTAEYTEVLEDGQKVVIYYPTDGKTAAKETYLYNNKKYELKSIDGTLDGTTLTCDPATAVLTVSVADGHYRFANDDGDYLLLDGTNVSWVAEDAIGNTDYTLFDLETAEGGFFVKSVNAQYNGNPQYLEYYDGYFTCYSFNASKAGIYTFRFYEAEPAPFLKDGQLVVIYNPANMMALSSVYTGTYNTGVAVTLKDGVLSGYTEAEVWKVGVNEDGTYTFSTKDGKKLSMAASYSSTPLDEVNTAWEISEANTENCVYIKNAARNTYLEWYAKYDDWSTYSNKSDEALFAQTIYKVDKYPGGGSIEGLTDGDMIVIYNESADMIFGIPDSMGTSLTAASVVIEDDAAIPGNGALIFIAEVDADGSVSFRAGDKYLATNSKEALFLSDTKGEGTKWNLTKNGNGFRIQSTDMKYYSSPVEIEYYSSSFSGWTFKSDSAEIFRFKFYPPKGEYDVIDGIVDSPEVTFTGSDAFVGMDYELTFTISHVFDLTEEHVDMNGVTLQPAYPETDTYKVIVPADLVKGDKLTFTVSGKDVEDVTFSAEYEVNVSDMPVITNLFPAANAQTKDDKQPEIGFMLVNAGEDPEVEMTVNGEKVTLVNEGDVYTYVPAEAMEDGAVAVIATVTRSDGKTSTASWKFTVGEAQYQLYFGQLHSHTAEYSDGAGQLVEGIGYVMNLPESANVDFVAFTDHSNYFDTTGAVNPEGALYDTTLMTADSLAKWTTYTTTIRSYNDSQNDVVFIPGFEMTWSGGPGHINTFNTAGVVSRNNSTLNNKTNDAGMKAYYALLSQNAGAESISQFNHPGSTFGTFSDFSYWDAVIDSRVYLVEVGNGEGAIGQGGYYPSYEQYIVALDKGWHVAPTNNQDNHKGKWGNANDARDVILTDDFSEEGLYEAIRQMRVYATEDKNLEIYYTLNDFQLGSVIKDVPDTIHIDVQVSDPDISDTITKVEVVVNSGKTAYTWDNAADLSTGVLSVDLAPDYSYYFIRVTEGDGDLAVTAPVWVGESLKLGISSFECGTATPVTNEELTLTTTLFNSEAADATVTSMTYTVNGSTVIGTDTTGYTISAAGTQDVTFKYTPTEAKVLNVTVTAAIVLDGKDYVFTKSIELDVQDADKLVYIGIDASHYNEYVNGNYKDSMGNFGALAAEYNVRTVQLNTGEELIAACSNEKYKALIFTAPSRRLAAAQEDPRTYTAEEIAAVKAFNENGGMVIVAGWSDYYENYEAITSNPNVKHMAETQNELLEALGTALRIADDATNDDSLNGGQTQRLYFSTYNFDSFLLDRVELDEENPNDALYTERFSQYGGAGIYLVDADGVQTADVPDDITLVVFGHESTYVKNSDNDDAPMSIKYQYAENDPRIAVLGTDETEGRGMIIVSGAAFMSNFEVQATVSDSGSEKNYSNYKVCENLLKYINPVQITPIEEVRQQTETGFKYTIEGTVTSNASGYDKDTAFFDCIYVQDETGGICCFPVAGNFKVGDKVRITGTTDFFQGEAELQVTSIEKIGDAEAVEAKETPAKDVNDGTATGSLVKVTGTVKDIGYANGTVENIFVEDANGDTVRVFIDGYITKDVEIKDLAVGCQITATGLASYDNTYNAPDGPFPRIRVRDRNEITCTPAAPVEYEFIEGDGSEWEKGDDGSLTFKANGPYSKFLGIEIDGQEISRNMYQAWEGSTVISLSDALLNSLTEGRHTIRAIYTDGDCYAVFSVVRENVGPATGYRSFMPLYIALAVLAAIFMVFAVKKNKVTK